MVRTVRAPNPSPMTLTGTNSYLLDCGGGQGLVIDPGPPIPAHVDELIARAAAEGLRIAYIVVSHGHPDHSAAATPLRAATGARVFAHPAGRTPRDANLPLERDLVAGELRLRTIDAPGHTFDHAIFYLEAERALFTGDTILGEGTTVIAPPGGAMRPYQRTLERLAREFADAKTIYGGHGPPVDDPPAKIAEYIAHRKMRERQILDALRDGPQTIPDLVRSIYSPEPSALWAAMARQILAHLLALTDEGLVITRPAVRGLSAQEQTMLNPDLSAIVGPHEAELLAAEIGTELRLETLDEYRLAEGRNAARSN